MKYDRSSGIILHPTSLPGPYGIGDLGPQAFTWIDFLASSDCNLWQVLPLGPTGYGDSPYQCFSAFAGNPYLISPELLVQDGLLQPGDLEGKPSLPDEQVDFGAVIYWKLGILDLAFLHFQQSPKKELADELETFRESNLHWLEDFALFMALKESHGGAPWHTWEAPLRKRQPEALAQARLTYAVAIQRQIFRQFLFFRQWMRLREYVASKGIRIIGDAPIFVAHDSADVWAHPELFYMDEEGNPTVVAGVPPDYFSPTGQLWGNPIYRWNVHAETGYAWWINRVKAVLQLVDIIRLDHFRGFAGYWEVPAGEETAVNGRWVSGPGKPFFTALQNELGDLPLIAEDLGEITADVTDLRDSLDLPGMMVFQFAFLNQPNEKFLPHNYPRNCVVYTGTHDNNTTRGWFENIPAHERDFCLSYLARDGSNIVWDSIRAIWGSVGMFSLAPMQDFLNLGSEARMNYPGKPSGNWTWRMPASALQDIRLREHIREFNYLYNRGRNAQKINELTHPKNYFEV